MLPIPENNVILITVIQLKKNCDGYGYEIQKLWIPENVKPYYINIK